MKKDAETRAERIINAFYNLPGILEEDTAKECALLCIAYMIQVKNARHSKALLEEIDVQISKYECTRH